MNNSIMIVFPSEFIPSHLFLQHQESNCSTNPVEKRSGKMMIVSTFYLFLFLLFYFQLSVSQTCMPVLCTLI